MQDTAHVKMTLDIAINVWLTDSYLRAMKWNTWEIHFKNFMVDIQISSESIRGRWKIWWLINSLTSFMQWYNWFWVCKMLVKWQTLSAQIHISSRSVSQINMFLVHITNIAYFFPVWVKKAKYLKDGFKMGPFLSEKLTLCWWRH